MLLRGAHYSVGVSHGCTQLEKKERGEGRAGKEEKQIKKVH